MSALSASGEVCQQRTHCCMRNGKAALLISSTEMTCSPVNNPFGIMKTENAQHMHAPARSSNMACKSSNRSFYMCLSSPREPLGGLRRSTALRNIKVRRKIGQRLISANLFDSSQARNLCEDVVGSKLLVVLSPGHRNVGPRSNPTEQFLIIIAQIKKTQHCQQTNWTSQVPLQTGYVDGTGEDSSRTAI